MPSYTIKINNKSGKDQYFLLFQAPPTRSTDLGQVWSNVWVKTGRTPSPNGSQKVVITEDIFAICGTTPVKIAEGVSVSESDFAGPVSLTSTSAGGTRTTCVVDGTPAFDQPPYSSTSKANSFAIFMSPYDPVANPNVIIGMGKYDDAGNVVPVLSFTPDPNTDFDITPNVTYYIATGKYSPGDVVDITKYGTTVAIDFTTAPSGWTAAEVTLQANGTYSAPKFTPPKGQNGLEMGQIEEHQHHKQIGGFEQRKQIAAF